MKSSFFAPWLVIAAGIVAAMHIGKLPPTLPLLQAQLSLNLSQSGWLLAAIQAAGIACSLLIGLLASRVGLKRLMVAGLLLLACAGVLESGMGGFGGLFAARLLEGLGFLSIVLIAPALLRQLVAPECLKMTMGFWAAYMGLGVAASLLLVPYLLHDAAWTWQQAWRLLAVLALLMAGLMWVGVPRDVPHHAANNAASFRHNLALTLRHPAPWLLGVVFACYTSQWFTVTGFLPTVYAAAEIQPTAAGVLTAMVCLSNVIGPIAAGWLLQRAWQPGYLLACGFAAMMLGSALTFGGSGVLPFAWQYGGVILFSAVGGLIPGVVFAYAVYLAPSTQTVSSTLGWVQQWSALGQFCLPPLLGVLVMWWGSWRSAWQVSAVLGCVGVLCAWQIQKLVRRLA